MKYKLIRESTLHLWEQDSKKWNDQRIRRGDHYDYVYLTDIPSSVGFDEADEAFVSFAQKVCNSIEHFTSISDYFSEIQILIDDKTGYCTFRFRFDKFDLDEEYEIDTESA